MDFPRINKEAVLGRHFDNKTNLKLRSVILATTREVFIKKFTSRISYAALWKFDANASLNISM